MTAPFFESSTPDKAIVQVMSNLNGEKEIFHLYINQIDPERVSRMEIFALCSYADKCGDGTASIFGSFHTFKVYEETAKQNDILDLFSKGKKLLHLYSKYTEKTA